MDPQTGRAGFGAALFIVVTSGMLIPFQEPMSAPFVLSVMTLGIGLIFLLVLIVVIRRSLR